MQALLPCPFGLSLPLPFGLRLSLPFGLSLSKPGIPFDKLRANGFLRAQPAPTVRAQPLPFGLSPYRSG